MITSRASDYTIRNVDDWKTVRRIQRKECVFPSYVAYSPDNLLVAMELSWGVIHLLRTDNFKTVALLDSPKRGRPSLFEFSGEGNTLFAFHHLTGEVHRWDIDGLQQRLQSMGLDWDDGEQDRAHSDFARSSSAVFKDDTPASPAWIAFGQSDANRVDERAVAQKRINDAEKALASHPDSPLAVNQLAWCLVTGPSELQDVERAIGLLEDPQHSTDLDVNSRNTLAVAYYRCAKYSEAMDLLRINLANQEDSYLTYDLYFLAMCYWKLGDHEKARETFQWSERMLRLKPPVDAESLGEIELFRSEAKELIQ
jgi:tetratricopeptide (TPR) repeat protein